MSTAVCLFESCPFRPRRRGETSLRSSVLRGEGECLQRWAPAVSVASVHARLTGSVVSTAVCLIESCPFRPRRRGETSLRSSVLRGEGECLQRWAPVASVASVHARLTGAVVSTAVCLFESCPFRPRRRGETSLRSSVLRGEGEGRQQNTPGSNFPGCFASCCRGARAMDGPLRSGAGVLYRGVMRAEFRTSSPGGNMPATPVRSASCHGVTAAGCVVRQRDESTR
ncbi:hypothetical protein DFO50_10151 [Microvirgula sp. AG722]|nr:hypothetical protein DFO50_10151 [Microvirgula sp. AG722]